MQDPGVLSLDDAVAGDAAVAFAVVATVVPPPVHRQKTERKCLNDAI